MFCINCGKKLDDNSKYCAFCGQKVYDQAQPQPTVQPSYNEDVTEKIKVEAIENTQKIGVIQDKRYVRAKIKPRYKVWLLLLVILINIVIVFLYLMKYYLARTSSDTYLENCMEAFLYSLIFITDPSENDVMALLPTVSRISLVCLIGYVFLSLVTIIKRTPKGYIGNTLGGFTIRTIGLVIFLSMVFTGYIFMFLMAFFFIIGGFVTLFFAPIALFVKAVLVCSNRHYTAFVDGRKIPVTKKNKTEYFNYDTGIYYIKKNC